MVVVRGESAEKSSTGVVTSGEDQSAEEREFGAPVILEENLIFAALKERPELNGVKTPAILEHAQRLPFLCLKDGFVVGFLKQRVLGEIAIEVLVVLADLKRG